MAPSPPLEVDSSPATWGSFIALPENASALTAARRLAQALAQSLAVSPTLASPRVFHGPTGTGKSALVQALVRDVTADAAGLTVQVVAAAEVPRPADDAPGDELAELRTADLLVVEDVQHLHQRAAGVLCRLLDHRAARRKPTVVTASRGPAGLAQLPRRLTSRLAAGLVVQLEPLTPAGRRVLLEQLAGRKKLRLADDAVDWLAGRATGGGFRPLAGLVEQLRALATGRTTGPLDAAAVRELLAGSQPTSRDEPVRAIVDRVAAAFGVKPRDVVGTCRQRTVLVPRQVAMYLARQAGKLSLMQVGAAFGGRDHTTVLHACRRVEEAIRADAKLKRTVRDLMAELT